MARLIAAVIERRDASMTIAEWLAHDDKLRALLAKA